MNSEYNLDWIFLILYYKQIKTWSDKIRSQLYIGWGTEMTDFKNRFS